MLGKIGFFLVFCVSVFGVEHIYLKEPNLSKENIIGTNVGVRPYRKSGVRIETEALQDKLIVHNYGYGGSGITLCFGGAKEVLDILNAQNRESKTVAILGGGVVGMATAYDLLKQGYEVHIYADAWSPNLTSDVGAGIWSPMVAPEDASDEKKQLIERLLVNAEERLSKNTCITAEFEGIRYIDSYSFQAGASQGAIKTKNRGEEVIVHFDNGVVKNGRKIRELAIDGKVFLEDLYSSVKTKGATLTTHHFETKEDLLDLPEPIIINCTSLGSRKLFNDQDFKPVRGQLLYFHPQAHFDYLIYENVPNETTAWVSIYPWSDRIVLGGVYEAYQEELQNDQPTLDRLLENAHRCLTGISD